LLYTNHDPIYSWPQLPGGGTAVNTHHPFEYLTPEQTVERYGRLYNFLAVIDSRGLCPIGWRVSSREDWLKLTDYLLTHFDDITEDNITMKLRSTTLWKDPYSLNDYNGTDDFGFNAVPAGYVENKGNSWGTNVITYWWAPDENNIRWCYYTHMASHYRLWSDIMATWSTLGYSVRCVKE
jgi:uncharacterized protein (TIGR02145 family)